MKYSIYILFLFLTLGCVDSQPKVDPNSRPVWIDNPTENGKFIAGIGSSGEHINGKEAQKALAISRAIDMIASQLGVTVDSEMNTQKQLNSGGFVSSSSVMNSLQTVSGVKVNAKLKATWEDRINNKFYVWMVKE